MKRLIFFAICSIIFLAGCAKPEVTSETYALNTICSQQIVGGNAKAAADEVGGMLWDITNAMSMNEGSHVWAVNEAAPGAARVSEETAEVIAAALHIAEETGGAFDPAIGALTRLWDITGDPRVPDAGEIEGALGLVDYRKASIDGTSVALGEAGMKLDLGGIAKGYAADKATEVYRKHGVERALLNLGGNIYAYGEKPGGENFRIGIRDPLGAEGEIAAIIKVNDTSVVTSGVYERFFESGGKTYHHIFDPKTGYPAENGLVSVTVVCKNSMRADALSTALFVMGMEQGLEFARSHQDIEAIFITQDRKVRVTDGLNESIEIANETYTLES
jgi:thiamine biosynthesis lipoprotein